MSYSAKAVANYFLSLAEAEGKEISPMKMQKLVYYAHGWFLAVSDGKPLIDEQVEAWGYGPVVPSLYHELKFYGHSPIEKPIADSVTEVIDSGLKMRFKHVVPSMDDYPDADLAKSVIEKTWQEYGKYSAVKLSNMTHEPGGPWDLVMNDYEGKPPHGTDIPRAYIEDHFLGSLRRNLKTDD